MKWATRWGFVPPIARVLGRGIARRAPLRRRGGGAGAGRRGGLAAQSDLQELYDITRAGAGPFAARRRTQRLVEGTPGPGAAGRFEKVALGPRNHRSIPGNAGIEFYARRLRGLVEPAGPAALLDFLEPKSSRRASPSDGQHRAARLVRARAQRSMFELPGWIRAGGQTPVPVFVQPSAGFRLPDAPDTPIIMVGPYGASRPSARSCTNARQRAPKAATGSSSANSGRDG